MLCSAEANGSLCLLEVSRLKSFAGEVCGKLYRNRWGLVLQQCWVIVSPISIFRLSFSLLI